MVTSSSPRTARIPGEETSAGAAAQLARAVPRLAVGAIAAAVGAWALCSLWWPYGADQGFFGYMGDAVLRGETPYREIWDPKGPLVYYVFAALQLVFGRQMWAVRVLDLSVITLGAFAAHRILRKFAGKTAAIVTVLMMVLAFASFGNWYTAQPDGWAALFLIVAVAFLVERDPASPRDAALAAFLIGGCTLGKPVYGAFVVLVPAALWPSSPSERPAALRSLALSAGAFLLPLALTAVWFAAHGALGALIDAQLRFPFERMTTDPHLVMSKSRVVQMSLGILTRTPALAAALPAAAFGAAFLLRERPRTGAVLVLWALGSLAIIAVQRKFAIQNYSWHPLFPPLGLLAGIGLSRLWSAGLSNGELRAARPLVVVTSILLFQQTSREPLGHVGRWLKYMRGHTTLAEYYGSFDVDVPALGGAPASEVGFGIERDVRIARYLREHTGPDDEVLLWNDFLANYLSDRRAFTRITAVTAFTFSGTEERRQRYRAELISGMTSPHATYFAIPSRDLAPGEDESNLPKSFPELALALAAHYDRVDKIDDVEIWKRKTDSP
jgi:Dolichyl-phosphate-mannose-protein mannosyltransferase